MRHLLTLFTAVFVSTVATAAEPIEIGTLKTKDGKTYEAVQVREVLPDGIKIMHATGLAKINHENLPAEVIEKVGGFDKARAAAHRNNERAKQTKAQLATQALERASQLDASTWEPYTSAIAKESRNVTDPALLKSLKDQLEIIKETCAPLIESDEVGRETVKEWVAATASNKIMKGMPLELVRLSWGAPLRANSDSEGDTNWHYRSSYVSFKNRFVNYFSVDQ